MADLSRFLDLIGWGAFGVLCVFMCLIARLFQRRSGIHTRPAMLALASGALAGVGLLESLRRPGPFPNWTSSLMAVAGVALVVAVIHIYGLMSGGPR
ncbi:MAG: hypothetical protein ACYC5O_09350 [Anaerolineae bacterium]